VADKVRLGINAPQSIAVHRKEVYEAIKRENARLGLKPEDIANVSGNPVTRQDAQAGLTACIRQDDDS